MVTSNVFTEEEKNNPSNCVLLFSSDELIDEAETYSDCLKWVRITERQSKMK